jgi:hypothetical protein
MSKSTKIKVTDPKEIEMVNQMIAYRKLEKIVNDNPNMTIPEAEAKAVELGLKLEYLPWR